ncbi:hypothetical protein EB118_04825 [bacterium]|nr:hypothetical protein [bacterium]NDC94161.1 hypothetical protein [bacterium]NDD82759.1 hypothetical protein [bacterium]NDG29410.1 hypothetical protein [bacterium]
MPSATVFGAGLAGLTVAHILTDHGYTVTVYEKDNVAGGMAKSKRTADGVPLEHSWRGYAPFYYNTFDMLSKIPVDVAKEDTPELHENFTSNLLSLEEVRKSNKRNKLWTYYKGDVYDITNWVPLHPGGEIILNAGGKDLEQVLNAFGLSWHLTNKRVLRELSKYRIGRLVEPFNEKTLLDTVFSKRKIAFKLLSDIHKDTHIQTFDYPFLWYSYLRYLLSDLRKDQFYNTRFLDVIRGRVSDSTYRYLVYFGAGPGFGFDLNTVSFGSYANVVRSVLQKRKPWSVASGPTNEVFIDPWVRYLESRGVEFRMRCSVRSVNIEGDRVAHCTVQSEDNVKSFTVSSDVYVLAINPNLTANVFPSDSPLFTTFTRLRTVNNQLGFVIKFKKKIILDEFTAFVLMDSKLNITFYAQDLHWDTRFRSAGSIWSGTCVQVANCKSNDIESLRKEILDEIVQSKHLQSILGIQNLADMVETIILYDEFKMDSSGSLVSMNPKWVNNVLNEQFRPDVTTMYPNLFLSGAHCKTTIGIWSMESAIESGKLAAEAILKIPIPHYNHNKTSKLVRSIRTLDNVLYNFNLPGVVDTTILLVVVVAILKM